MSKPTSTLKALFAVILLGLGLNTAQAQSDAASKFPTKTIKLVVGFAPVAERTRPRVRSR